ncbi:MAG: GNAT family N-acetyltransferase [Eubacteriales bacterium]|nr:GNAT family N-acetyltransferase [Eubacteriales bacterium]
MTNIEVIHGDGIVLTPITEKDIDSIITAYQDPEIQKWTTVPTDGAEEDAREFIEVYGPAIVLQGGMVWGIRQKIDGELIGAIDIRKWEDRCYDVGYWIHEKYRSQGFCEKALNLVCDTAFDHFKATRISLVIWKGNWASWRLAWKCGFRKEADLRNVWIEKFNETRTVLLASLTPHDPRQPVIPWDGPTGATQLADPPPSEKDPEGLVKQFHHVYGMPIVTDGANVDYERVHMRMSLIYEEVTELTAALYGEEAEQIVEEAFKRAMDADDGRRDVVEVADALADLIYVIYGMGLESGINLPAVLRQVQASNLSKLGEDGKPIYREDGKVLKGKDFFPPDVAGALEEHVTENW